MFPRKTLLTTLSTFLTVVHGDHVKGRRNFYWQIYNWISLIFVILDMLWDKLKSSSCPNETTHTVCSPTKNERRSLMNTCVYSSTYSIQKVYLHHKFHMRIVIGGGRGSRAEGFSKPNQTRPGPNSHFKNSARLGRVRVKCSDHPKKRILKIRKNKS